MRSPLRRWFVSQGWIGLAISAQVFVAGALVESWPRAYDLMDGLLTPDAESQTVLDTAASFALSLDGAFTIICLGTIVGYTIIEQLKEQGRGATTDQLLAAPLERMRMRTSRVARIERLSVIKLESPDWVPFLGPWITLLHGGDTERSELHWLIIAGEFLEHGYLQRRNGASAARYAELLAAQELTIHMQRGGTCPHCAPADGTAAPSVDSRF